MKAIYNVEFRGSTAIIQVMLDDGRGFTLYTGKDHLNEIEKLIKEHSMALFNIEVDSVEESK